MSEIVRDGFKFQDSAEYPDDLMLETSRLDECLAYLEKNRCRAVSLYYPFLGDDSAFLERYPWLEQVSINTGRHIANVDVVNLLPRLKNAFLREMGFCFTNPNTEKLMFTWTRKSAVDPGCTRLKSIAVNACKDPAALFDSFSRLGSLESVRLVKAVMEELPDTVRHPTLRSLGIYYSSALKKIDGIAALGESLHELCIEGCPGIADYAPIGSLSELRSLKILKCRKMDSLAFLQGMKKMREIRLLGTKVLDHDYSYCRNYDFVAADE